MSADEHSIGSNTPSQCVKLSHRFTDNPFKDRQSRTTYISTKHEAIFKQFSSANFDTVSIDNILADLEEDGIDNINRNTIHIHQQNNTNADNEDIDIDDTLPLIFEFPYVELFQFLHYSIYISACAHQHST